MNSEELEQSLRTEFESYLKNVFADIRQDISEFQKKFEDELEKHKSRLDESFHEFSVNFAEDKAVDEAFKDSVVEHLRLARDEGARITATAIAEAEELEKQQVVVESSSTAVADLRDAIRDISLKTTQSAILKSLVMHASKFTSRGAFFIIKNEHLVGWRVFGSECDFEDKSVREVFFPVNNETLLGEAVSKLEAVEGSYGTFADDSIYLNRLKFGQPDRMYAIPLVVRERAVAVLYADYGTTGSNVNVEALETLVQVASLTVEISASARSSAQTQMESAAVAHDETPIQEEVQEFVEETTERQPVFEETNFESVSEATVSNEFQQSDYSQFQQPVEETYSSPQFEQSFDTEPTQVESESFAFTPSLETEQKVEEVEQIAMPEEELVQPISSFEQNDFQSLPVEEQTFEPKPAWSQQTSNEDSYSFEPKTSFETSTYDSFEVPEVETVEEEITVENDYNSPVVNEYQFETSPSFETTTSYEVEDYTSTNGQSYSPVETQIPEIETNVSVQESVETVPATTVRSRLSERNVDLPIEVSEDERRLHNDARRFARLLVSEIKLYNEQKVKEGREANDLYERLREAIDRSREMYDKRVQPPVATKFDYFHYELVSNLAEGDENRLGTSYPGTAL